MQAEALAAVAAVVAGLGETDRAAPAVQADALRGALRAARDSTDAATRIATAGARDGHVTSISLTGRLSGVLGSHTCLSMLTSQVMSLCTILITKALAAQCSLKQPGDAVVLQSWGQGIRG